MKLDESSYPQQDDERREWVRALAKVSEGEADGIVMHVDTLRLLADQDWDDLKMLGLSVGVFRKAED